MKMKRNGRKGMASMASRHNSNEMKNVRKGAAKKSGKYICCVPRVGGLRNRLSRAAQESGRKWA